MAKSLDHEHGALGKCLRAIGELGPEAQARVVEYLSDRFRGDGSRHAGRLTLGGAQPRISFDDEAAKAAADAKAAGL